MTGLVALLVVVFAGLVMGSLATALSYRLPLGVAVGLSRSRCPSCDKTLSPLELVPLLSWIFLRGKCRGCSAVIGWHYPATELATVLLCLALYKVYGLHASTWPVFLLAPVLVSILHIDVVHKIIPDILTLTVALIGALILFLGAWESGGMVGFLIRNGGPALAGAAAFGFGSWLLRWGAMQVMKREGMGLGDVKFYAASGFWLGLDAEAISTFLLVSAFLGLVIALAWRKRTGEAEVPFGPSLVVGLMVAVCFHVPGIMIR